MSNNISEEQIDFKYNFSFMQYNLNRGIETEKLGEQSPYCWPNRESRIIELVKKYNPDIIGFQELRELPNRTPVYEFLLNFQKMGYNYSIQSPNPNSMAFAQVTLWKKEKFFSTESKSMWLSDTPNIVSDTWNKKRCFGHVCFGVKLLPVNKNKDKIIGNANPLWIFNTHFSLEENFKTMASKKIVEIMNQMSDNKQNYVLTGDFNFFPKDPERGEFYGDEQRAEISKILIDCGKNALTNRGKTVNGTFVGIESDLFKAPLPNLNNSRLDHVFATPNLLVKKAIIITDTMKEKEPEIELSDRELPSDHLPIFVHFFE